MTKPLRDLTAVLAGLILLGWGMGVLVLHVAHGVFHAGVDRPVNRWVHAHHSHGVGHVLIEVAHLGSAGVAFAVALLAGGIWAIRRRRPAPLAVLGLAYGGGAIVGLAVKVLVRRGQSGLPGGLSSLTQLGFPSGHATLAAAVYGTMAALLARRGARWHRILAGGLVGLAVVIGVARVYNGQHETTDVIAGWILGGLWAWTVATIVTGLERRTASAPAGREHEAGPCVAL